jgi:hypothetical protein
VSGETEASVSGWTTDTLHTHFIRQLDMLRAEIRETAERDRRAVDLAFNAQTTAMAAALASADRAVAAALSSAEKAVTVAQVAAEKRADIANEWRGSLNDVSQRAMPRSEAEAIIARSTDRIQEMATQVALLLTRAEYDAARQRDTERMTELTTRVTAVEQYAKGALGNRTGIYAALGVATALIVAIVVVLNFVTSR